MRFRSTRLGSAPGYERPGALPSDQSPGRGGQEKGDPSSRSAGLRPHPTGWRRSPYAQSRSHRSFGFVIALPAMVLFVAFALYPMADVIYLSFYHYNLLQPPSFVGFANYRALASDPEAIASIVRTIEYCGLTYVPTIVIALGLALAVNTRLAGAGVVRTLWFVPFAMSWVAVAVLWNLIFQPQGLLDAIIKVPVYWLTTSSAAPFAVAIMSVWKQVGFFMILFLAGLQRIPSELYGAASVDGAGPVARFRNVTMPQLRPTLLLVGIIAIYYGLTAFDPMYVLTGGGPANATETFSLYIFKTAFEYGQMGQASALAVPLFLVLLVIGIGQWFVYRRHGGE